MAGLEHQVSTQTKQPPICPWKCWQHFFDVTCCASDVAHWCQLRVCESFVDQGIINRVQTSTKRGFLLTYQRIHPEEVLQHFFTMGGSRSTKHKPNTSHFKTISKPEEGNCFYFSQQPECQYPTTLNKTLFWQTKQNLESPAWPVSLESRNTEGFTEPCLTLLKLVV